MRSIFFQLLAFSFLLFLSACAHRPIPGTETSDLSGHISHVQSDLSRADGKAVVIEEYLRSH